MRVEDGVFGFYSTAPALTSSKIPRRQWQPVLQPRDVDQAGLQRHLAAQHHLPADDGVFSILFYYQWGCK